MEEDLGHKSNFMEDINFNIRKIEEKNKICRQNAKLLKENTKSGNSFFSKIINFFS